MKGQGPTASGNHGADGAGAVNRAGEKRSRITSVRDKSCKIKPVKLPNGTWDKLRLIAMTVSLFPDTVTSSVIRELIEAEYERLVESGDILL